MKLDINYRTFTITFQCGYYWLPNWKTPYHTLREAKETIDFILDEELIYAND
jgi:hypothetical protein